MKISWMFLESYIGLICENRVFEYQSIAFIFYDCYTYNVVFLSVLHCYDS